MKVLLLIQYHGWEGKTVWLEGIPLEEYERISVTYSFKAGYDFALGLVNKENTGEGVYNSALSLNTNGDKRGKDVERNTVTVDIPKDVYYSRIHISSSSLNAKHYIYKIQLFKD